MAVARLGAIAAGLIAVAVVSVTTLGPVAARMLTGAGHVGKPAPPGDIALAPLEQRSRVLASDGAELAVLHGEHNRELVALADLPPIVPAAVITAEDRRFAEHAGYDPRGIARAALTNLREGRMAAGGSTITQQVAKANFTDGARTLKRKLVELGYARALEAQLSKDEILERYLNEVYVGRGAYGVAAGAQAFFGRDVADLEVHHAALLAGMIAAPEHFDPIRHPELATARRNHVLAGMVDEDHLSPVRADLAANQPLDVVAFHRLQPRDPYVIEQVKRELLAEPALGDTRQQRIDALFSGGLQIHTSIDWRLQEHADLAVLSTHERVPAEPLELADDPHEGQKVTVVGYPAGGRITVESNIRVTDIVDGSRYTDASDEIAAPDRIVLIDADSVQPGSSGGPVLDTSGRLVAVIFATDTQTGAALALPVSTLRSELQ